MGKGKIAGERTGGCRKGGREEGGEWMRWGKREDRRNVGRRREWGAGWTGGRRGTRVDDRMVEGDQEEGGQEDGGQEEGGWEEGGGRTSRLPHAQQCIGLGTHWSH